MFGKIKKSVVDVENSIMMQKLRELSVHREDAEIRKIQAETRLIDAQADALETNNKNEKAKVSKQTAKK